jgi:PST family polysaccharide transporter
LEHRDLKRRSVHGAAATVLSQGVRFVVQFAAQVLLARLLAPSEFGIVAMVMPLVGFVQMFTDLGLLQVTVQKPEITQNELSALFWVSVAVSTGLALLVVLLSPLAAWFYHEPRATAVTAAVGSLLILSGLAAQPMAVMNRQMRFVPLAIIDIAAAVAAGVGGIAAAADGFGYWSLVIMQAANATSMLVLAWAFSGWRPSRPRHVPGLGALLRFGGSVTGANVVNYLSYTMDNVLIGARWGDVQLGFYDRGFRLMLLPVVQIVMPFTRVAVPLLSRLQHIPERYRVAYTRIMRAVLLVTTPAIVFAIVNARPLLLSVLGPRWSPAVPIFAWLGLSALLAPIKLSLSWLFISQSRAHEQFRCTCIGTVIMIGAFLAGLRWGAAGVAAATAITSWVLYSPLLCWMATRSGPVRLRDLCDVIYPVLIAGATAWAVLSALRGALPAAWPFGLPCALAIAYLVQVIVFACLPQGWTALLEVWELRAMFARSASRSAADA